MYRGFSIQDMAHQVGLPACSGTANRLFAPPAEADFVLVSAC